MIDFEYLLSKIGYFGKFQILVLAMIFYSGIPSGLNSIGPVFQSYSPPYRCSVPPFDNNDTYYNVTDLQISEYMIPKDDENFYDNCSRYKYDRTGCDDGSFNCVESISNETESCIDGYYYDRSCFSETVVTELDLVCDKVLYSYIATSLYMFGLFIGSILFGYIADRFGRRPTLIVSSIGCAVGMVGAGLSYVYWLYVLFRLIIAFFGYGLTISCFVTVMEVVGPKWRALSGVGYQGAFAIGYMILSGIAYGLRDWRNMQWAMILVSLPFGVFLFFIPESPRWLFSINRDERGRKITEKMAKFNGVQLTSEDWEEAARIGAEKSEEAKREKEEAERYSFKDLFRGPGIRRNMLIVIFCWFTNSMVYYGLTLNVGTLNGSIFVNNAVGGAMELLSYGICILTLDLVGRRFLHSGMLLFCGVTLTIHTVLNEYAVDEAGVVVDDGLGKAANTFAFLSKIGVSGSYAVIYTFTSELFPTVVRSNSIGIGSAGARIGGIFAPLMLAAQEKVSWLGNILFAAFAIFGAIASVFLPETTGIDAIDSLEAAELFYAGKEFQKSASNGSSKPLPESKEALAYENRGLEMNSDAGTKL